ncbi:MAG: hypothetical protein ACLT2Z_08275 [Eubacterium sp.]
METDGVFEKTNTATQISIFERNSALGENALKVLSEYAPEKKECCQPWRAKEI